MISHQTGDATGGPPWDPRTLHIECVPSSAAAVHSAPLGSCGQGTVPGPAQSRDPPPVVLNQGHLAPQMGIFGNV